MSWIDQVPLDYSEKNTRTLLTLLKRVYRSPGPLNQIAVMAGIDVAHINFGQPPALLPLEILDQAANEVKMVNLLAEVLVDGSARAIRDNLLSLLDQRDAQRVLCARHRSRAELRSHIRVSTGGRIRGEQPQRRSAEDRECQCEVRRPGGLPTQASGGRSPCPPDGDRRTRCWHGLARGARLCDYGLSRHRGGGREVVFPVGPVGHENRAVARQSGSLARTRNQIHRESFSWPRAATPGGRSSFPKRVPSRASSITRSCSWPSRSASRASLPTARARSNGVGSPFRLFRTPSINRRDC